MGDATYNPDDPAFLLSRSLDEELTEDEQRRLDEAMASSPPARQEAEKLRALDRLIRRWGAEKVALDWENQRHLIVAEASSEDDAEGLGKVDALIERWGAEVVPFDEDRFTASVMKQVASEPGRKWRGLILRLGAPLAAAAAIALVVTIGIDRPASRNPISVIEFGSRLAMADPRTTPIGAPTAIVSFGRLPVEVGEVHADEAVMGFGAVGSTAMMTLPGESPPL